MNPQDPALADSADPADLNDPNPIASATPGEDTAPQTIDDTAGADDPNQRTVSAMLDEAETRLDEAERAVADLLVQRMTDVPIEREDIRLSTSGDTTRPNDAPLPTDRPVVAAVDMSATGGFDADGVWHDVLGRFAKKGWSGAKAALLDVLKGDRAREAVRDAGDGGRSLRLTDERLARRLKLTGDVIARFGDDVHALVQNADGRTIRVPWSAFHEEHLDDFNDMATMRVPNPAYPHIEQGLTDGPRGKTTEYRVKVNGETVFASTRKPEANRRLNAEIAEAKAAGVPARIDSEYDDTVLDEYDTPALPATPAPAPAEVSLDPEVNRALIDADNVASLTHGTDVGHYNVFTRDGSGDLRNVPYADLPAGAKAWLVESDRRWKRGRFAGDFNDMASSGPVSLFGHDAPTVSIDDLTPDGLRALADAHSHEALGGDGPGTEGEATVAVGDRLVRLEWADEASYRTSSLADVSHRVWVNGNEVIETIGDGEGNEEDGHPVGGGGMDAILADPDNYDTIIAAVRDAAEKSPVPPRRPQFDVSTTAPVPTFVDGPDGRTPGPDLPPAKRLTVRFQPDGHVIAWDLGRAHHIDDPAFLAALDRIHPDNHDGDFNDLPQHVIRHGDPEGPDNQALHGTWHLLNGTRYAGEWNITKATPVGDPNEDWHQITNDRGVQWVTRPDDMFPTEAAARAAARERRAPRTPRAPRPAYGDHATIALLNGINPQTGRKFTTTTETQTRNTPTPTAPDYNDLPPARMPLRAQQFNDAWVRDQAVAMGADPARVAGGRPLVDVSYAVDGADARLTRRAGVLGTDGAFLAASADEAVVVPLAGMDVTDLAEGYARSVAGYGVDARIRREGDLDGDLVVAGAGFNDMPTRGSVVPDLDENGHFPTVERLDAESVEWDTQPDPDFPEDTRSALNIVTQYVADSNDDPSLNEVEVRIFGSDGRFDWWVDGANAMDRHWLQRYPSDFGGAFDWPDPTEAAPWAESGNARTLAEAQAQALDAVNRLPLLATVKPIDMVHTVDGPNAALAHLKAEQRAGRGHRFSKWSDPSRDYTIATDRGAVIAEVTHTDLDPNQGDLFDGEFNDLSPYPTEYQGVALAAMSADQLGIAVDSADTEYRQAGAAVQGAAARLASRSSITPKAEARQRLNDAKERLSQATSLRAALAIEVDKRGMTTSRDSRGRTMVGYPADFEPITGERRVTVLNTPTPTPTADGDGPARNRIIGGKGVFADRNPSTGEPTERRITTDGGVFEFKPRRTPSPELRAEPNYLTITTRGLDDDGRPYQAMRGPAPKVAGQVQIDGPDAALHSGSLVLPVPPAMRGNPAKVVEWAATVIGNGDEAVGRVAASRSPLDVYGVVLDSPTPHGVVVMRGTMAQPFFEATSIADALARANGGTVSTVGRYGEQTTRSAPAYPGRPAFNRRLTNQPDNTKVLVLNEVSAARWKAAYDGVLADMDAAKARRDEKAAARRAAREARQQTLPDANDLIDMPPADRALAATTPTGAWLIAKDNYLSRVGVPKGSAVQVRHSGDHGTIDVLRDDGTLGTQDVKWDRFADTAPAAAPKVVLPEAVGNAKVASKAEAARSTAARVQAAGDAGAPVEVADGYLARYGAPKGTVLTVHYLDDRNAVFNVDGRQVKAGWARFTPRVPEPDGQGGWELRHPPEDDALGEFNDLTDGDDLAGTILRQIGGLTVAAISGGRRQPITNDKGDTIGVTLPVGNGYRVDVIYDPSWDAYTVHRVFSRKGVDYPKGTMTGVYADMLSDVAYTASSFRSYPFGSADFNDLPGTGVTLADLAPSEVYAIGNAATMFAERGWAATDPIGGFRSPDGHVTVSRHPGGWKAVDRRRNAFIGEGQHGTIDAWAIPEWAAERDAALAVTPVDTTKFVDDAKLASWAADPNVHLYPSSDLLPASPRDRSRYGIIARSADGTTVAEVVARFRTPNEAQGAWDDVRRRLTEFGQTPEGRALLDNALPPTLARPADVKASAVKRGDWIHSIQGTDVAGGWRVEGLGAEGEGTVRLVGPGEGQDVTVPAVAAVSIARPVPDAAADADLPTYTEATGPEALAVMSPARRAAVADAATRVAAEAPVGSARHAEATRVAADAATPGRPSIDGKSVDGTAIVLDAHGVPPKPGTAAIPPGAIRLYHYPSDGTPLDYLLDTGVTGRDGRTAWAQTYPPVADVTPFVEFWTTPENTTPGDLPGGHVAVGPVSADQIVSYSTPTTAAIRQFRAAPYLWNEGTLRASLGRYRAGTPEHAAAVARLAEMGVDLTTPAGDDFNDLRPFDAVRRFMNPVPDRAALIALAATGVPNGNGRIPTADEIAAMSPSELTALDRAMARWLAAHPYGEHSGANLLDTLTVPDDPDPEPVVPAKRTVPTKPRVVRATPGSAPFPLRARRVPRRSATGGTLGYIPMSPLDAPADWADPAVVAALAEVEDTPLPEDLVWLDSDDRPVTVGDEVLTSDGIDDVHGRCIVADLDHGIVTKLIPGGLIEVDGWAEATSPVIVPAAAMRLTVIDQPLPPD